MHPCDDAERPGRGDSATCSSSVRPGRNARGAQRGAAGPQAVFGARECHRAWPGAIAMTPSERIIPFVKASACGNDFLIVDGLYASADMADLSQRICDRHLGVGADGVEWLFPA